MIDQILKALCLSPKILSCSLCNFLGRTASYECTTFSTSSSDVVIVRWGDIGTMGTILQLLILITKVSEDFDSVGSSGQIQNVMQQHNELEQQFSDSPRKL